MEALRSSYIRVLCVRIKCNWIEMNWIGGAKVKVPTVCYYFVYTYVFCTYCSSYFYKFLFWIFFTNFCFVFFSQIFFTKGIAFVLLLFIQYYFRELIWDYSVLWFRTTRRILHKSKLFLIHLPYSTISLKLWLTSKYILSLWKYSWQ